MVRGRARIESLEAGRDALAEGIAGGGEALVVPVADTLPGWFERLAIEAAAQGVAVLVEAEPPADRDGEVLDGWEIGLCTTALTLGADDVLGIDPRRVARVRTVVDTLDAAAPLPTQEPAS